MQWTGPHASIGGAKIPLFANQSTHSAPFPAKNVRNFRQHNGQSNLLVRADAVRHDMLCGLQITTPPVPLKMTNFPF